MSFRQVEDCGAGFVKKLVKIGKALPKEYSIDRLVEDKDRFTEEEFIALHQQFSELEVSQLATPEEKAILAPLVEFFFDNNNIPVLVYPKFTPILPQEDAALLSEEDAVARTLYEFSLKGVSDEKLGKFYNLGFSICENFYLSKEDCLYNLNNIGYHEVFGFRIIDFGLSEELAGY